MKPLLVYATLVVVAVVAIDATQVVDRTIISSPWPASEARELSTSKQSEHGHFDKVSDTRQRRLQAMPQQPLQQQQQQQQQQQVDLKALQFSLSACEKIHMALRFITSLDFEEHFNRTWYAYYSISSSTLTVNDTDGSSDGTIDDSSVNTRTANAFILEDWERDAQSKFYTQVYLLQLLIGPTSLGLLLLGASCFYPTCILCSAVGGLLGTYSLLSTWSKTAAVLDCPTTLALSVVVALIAAVLAVSFFRFGLFCFGSVSLGGACYFVLDSLSPYFLQQDSIVAGIFWNTTLSSSALEISNEITNEITNDLSPAAWILVVLASLLGGVLLRYYEEATLELMTAGLGGMGCAYSLHTLCLTQIHVVLDPSLVVLCAFFLGVIGWRFQRHRRFQKLGYHPLVVSPHNTSETQVFMETQRLQQLQLQQALQQGLTQLTTHAGSEKQHHQQQAPPSSEQITELTSSINRFLQAMEQGQLPKSESAAKKK